MHIEKFVVGPFGNNVYLLISDNKQNKIIIDPAKGSFDKIEKFLKENDYSSDVDLVLLTHSHWDHIGDAGKFQKGLGSKVYVHKNDRENLEKPGADGLFSIVQIEGCLPDKLLLGGEKINLSEMNIEVIHTPGHSEGSVCYYLKDKDILFTGDTLFKGTYGNTSFKGSDSEKMKKSLEKISTFPQNTLIMPGHGPETYLKDESWL